LRVKTPPRSDLRAVARLVVFNCSEGCNLCVLCLLFGISPAATSLENNDACQEDTANEVTRCEVDDWLDQDGWNRAFGR